MVVFYSLSYLVNTYMVIHQIPYYTSSISYIKFLPYLLLSIVVVYGSLHAKRLSSDNQTKEAAMLVSILFVLVFIGLFVIFLSFGIGLRFYL